MGNLELGAIGLIVIFAYFKEILELKAKLNNFQFLFKIFELFLTFFFFFLLFKRQLRKKLISGIWNRCNLCSALQFKSGL